MNQLRRVALVGALLLSPAAFAGNYSFMADSPVTRFNAADKALYRAAIDKALAAEPGQPPVEWRNDQTGSAGSVSVRAADQPDCRLLAVTTRHAGMRGEAEHKVCKVGGQWKIAK